MSENSESLLIEPLDLGTWKLPNRVFMAPMTRLRADALSVPSSLVGEYYAQRASAGLIISEAMSVSAFGEGFPNIAGIFNDDQEDGWRAVVDEVHKRGGHIVAQLMHVGKARFEDPNGPTKQPGWAISEPLQPHELTDADLADVVTGYRDGALRTKSAGFDGIEFYNCNGAIMDRFLRPITNHRTDNYGGKIENRVRLTLDSLDAVLSIWPPEKVGIRISPSTTIDGLEDPSAEKTFQYLISELNKRGLVYLHMTRNTKLDKDRGAGRDIDLKTLRDIFRGRTILAGDFDVNMAESALASGLADAIAFARLFIANPDLPARIASKAALNSPQPSTFYTSGLEGYTDYPSLEF